MPQPDATIISNIVPFEAYADIAVRMDGVSEVERDFLLSEVVQAVHMMIVKGSRLALAFPGHTPAGVGSVVRLFGSTHDIEDFLVSDRISGLKTARVIETTAAARPPETNEGAVYLRVDPERYSKGALRRLEERARRRRRAEKTLMSERDIKDRTQALKAKRSADALPPRVGIVSLSTSQRFPLYIDTKTAPISGVRFNSYGLSNGQGAVPAF